MEFCGKAAKAKEEQQIAQYKEEINLIIADEVAERKIEAKENLMIESLETKIREKEWVSQIDKLDKDQDVTENLEMSVFLLVRSKEGYEILIKVDNENNTAEIISAIKGTGKSYVITYDPNGGTGDAMEGQTVKEGLSVILKTCSYTRSDYTFVGWCEDAKGQGEVYSGKASYEPKKDVTLYAIWESNYTTLIMNGNGVPYANHRQVRKGQDTKIPKNDFKLEGYQFVEWNTEPDGSGTKYQDGAWINITEVTTLYAIWEVAPAEVGKKVIITKKNNYTDDDGETATVPAGFAVVPGCSDISEGLVISDVANDTENTGNQFVWIPVDVANFRRIAGYKNNELQNLNDFIEPYENGYENEKEEYERMYRKVTEYKGFYIGRYEAGKDSAGNVVVKKGADVYNSVPWGNTMDDIETSNTEEKVGAVKLAKEFTTKKKYSGVTSMLCYGIQWDTAIKFIDSNYTGFAKDSTNQGWYSENYNNNQMGNIGTNPNHITGLDLIYSNQPKVIANKQKNIYDMAGNVAEWTMEADNNGTKRIMRRRLRYKWFMGASF